MSTMQTGAVFDDTGQYRYRLWRIWNRHAARVGFVLLNPSTADATRDDPTIRRCLRFAAAWGFGGVEVLNLFAYRTPRPKLLFRAADPVGPDNDRYLHNAARRIDPLVLAWGNHGACLGRDLHVLNLLENGRPLFCLGQTRLGQPRHPLYLAKLTELEPFA